MEYTPTFFVSQTRNLILIIPRVESGNTSEDSFRNESHLAAVNYSASGICTSFIKLILVQPVWNRLFKETPRKQIDRVIQSFQLIPDPQWRGNISLWVSTMRFLFLHLLALPFLVFCIGRGGKKNSFSRNISKIIEPTSSRQFSLPNSNDSFRIHWISSRLFEKNFKKSFLIFLIKKKKETNKNKSLHSGIRLDLVEFLAYEFLIVRNEI